MTNEVQIPTLHPQGQSRIKATADLLGVHHQTLRRWWRTGKFIKPTNINGILMFRNADILAWLDKQHANAVDNATATNGEV